MFKNEVYTHGGPCDVPLRLTIHTSPSVGRPCASWLHFAYTHGRPCV